MRLNGRIALVTGATGGIGSATVRRLAAEGAAVVVTDVDLNRCVALAKELHELGATAEPHALDVADEEAWQRVVHDVTGALGGINVLVNNAGIGYFTTVGGFGSSFSYHAAKGAVRVMTKNAALHWAQRGVRVNSVHPGFIATGTLIERTSGTPREKAMVDGTPMRRLGRPEEVAAAIAFLAGDESTYVTGSELYVDGGWTAQ